MADLCPRDSRMTPIDNVVWDWIVGHPEVMFRTTTVTAVRRVPPHCAFENWPKNVLQGS